MALALLSRVILLGLWQVMLIECHECGGKVSTEAKACVRCGAPPQMPAKCHECEALMPVNSRICKECGAPVVAGVGTPALPRPAILDEQVVDSKPAPPPLPPSRIEHVNFDSARYQAYCPLCRNRFYVKGSALKKDDVVRCPNHKKGSRGGIYKVSDLRIFQREGEVVRYHVLKDRRGDWIYDLATSDLCCLVCCISSHLDKETTGSRMPLRMDFDPRIIRGFYGLLVSNSLPNNN